MADDPLKPAHVAGSSVVANELYTRHVRAYLAFNSIFRAPQAYQSFFGSYERLRPDLRILDAGCGTGLDALALVRALRTRGLGYRSIDGFDLTPAMLEHFRRSVDDRRLPNVRLMQADILEPESLPTDWTDYDLIVSAAMFEYVPPQAIVGALRSLRLRLARDGTFLLFITRRNWITAGLIEKPWKANRYDAAQLRVALKSAGFGEVTFRKFPSSYFWHNYWAHVIEAPPAPELSE